jgi:hypothetical protein
MFNKPLVRPGVTHSREPRGVDIDDLCFGDARYPAALTLAVLMAYGGSVSYVSACHAAKCPTPLEEHR